MQRGRFKHSKEKGGDDQFFASLVHAAAAWYMPIFLLDDSPIEGATAMTFQRARRQNKPGGRGVASFPRDVVAPL